LYRVWEKLIGPE